MNGASKKSVEAFADASSMMITSYLRVCIDLLRFIRVCKRRRSVEG
jgi:hypothetical protein